MTDQRRSAVGPSQVAEWIALGAGTLILTMLERTERGWDWVLMPLGVLFIVGAAILDYRQNRVARDSIMSVTQLAVQYRAELAVTLGDAITPIAALIGRIASATPHTRPSLQRQLCQMVVNAASALCGPDRTRGVFFALSEDGTELRAEAWGGRFDEPSTVFKKGDDDIGTQAHTLVERHDYMLVEDVRLPPSDVHLRSDTIYGTFLAVSVYSDGINHGMLTVDAIGKGTLDDNDTFKARALAQLLGAGLAVGDR